MSRSGPLRTPPTPLQVDARIVVAVGTALWLSATIVLVVGWGWLADHDHENWLWTCVAGTALGIAGLALMRKHRSEGRL